MIREVREYKSLVTKDKLTATTFAADILKRRIEQAIEPFVRNPKQLNLEQRRMLLLLFIETGLTRVNFKDFKT